MKKKIIVSFIAGLMAVSMFSALTGCGKNVNVNIYNEPSEEAESEDAEAEDTGEDEAEDVELPEYEEYKNSRGWSVKYDPSLITVNEAEDMTSFVYTGESAGTNMLSISYVPDEQPEEVLAKLTQGWDDPEAIVRSESYFPGTNDKWGYWRNPKDNGEGSGLSEDIFAGEYNGGVLVFDFVTHKAGDDEMDMAVSDTLSGIIDSITYDDFEPQTMYDYYPGVYKMTETEEIEGEEVTYEYSVTLNEDHSGLISMQDDINVMWGSTMLIQADNSYEYTIEGDNLMLNLDGNWLTFTREGAAKDTGVLPAYKYPGDDKLMAAVYEYIAEECSKDYEKADVSIPVVNLVDTDDSDPEDIKVWGDFWINNYKLEDDTLMTQSGGSYPGCIHLKKSGDDYEVTEMEVVGDGSEYLPTARKIFGNRFDDLTKVMDDEKRSEIRGQIIADYVKANDLKITKYQDFGWDPVDLPR
ncbi:MAG TPA: hypothetical protein DIS78_02085 [Lachnospiraceae bacterium]|nr:hypothetical protein [Lachnospiraceae bacterium]